MRSLFFLFSVVLSGLLPVPSTAGDISTGKRTGAGFDAYHIRYFKLFPNVDSAQSARFAPHADADSVTVEISRTRPLADTTFALHVSTTATISDYVDHFEELFTGQHTLEWDRIAFYVRAIRTFVDRDPVTVRTRSGATHTGRLFAANDSLLLVYTGHYPTDWRTYSAATVPVPFYDVAAVDDLVIAGNRELYATAQPYLQRRLMFLSIPPECLNTMRAVRVQESVPAESLEPAELLIEEHYTRRLHIVLKAGVAAMTPLLDPAQSLPGSTYDRSTDPRNSAVYPFTEVELGYSLTRRLHVGLSAGFLPVRQSRNTFDYRSAASLVEQSVEGWFAGARAAYSIIAANPRMEDRFEWQIGTALLFQEGALQTTLHTTTRVDGVRYYKKTVLPSATDTSIDVALSTTIRYYLSPAVSISLLGDYVPSGTLSTGTGGNKVTINLDRLTVGAGIGIHL